MPGTDNQMKVLEFSRLTARFGTMISRVCYFYATDVDDFNDLRQEALLNLWRGTGSFRGEADMATWVYRITLNSCVSYVRKNRRRHSEPIEEHPEIVCEDDEKAAMVREMYAMIARLDPLDKAMILMWLDGYDYASIANVTGLNKATVGTRLHRIKERLAKLSES